MRLKPNSMPAPLSGGCGTRTRPPSAVDATTTKYRAENRQEIFKLNVVAGSNASRRASCWVRRVGEHQRLKIVHLRQPVE